MIEQYAIAELLITTLLNEWPAARIKSSIDIGFELIDLDHEPWGIRILVSTAGFATVTICPPDGTEYLHIAQSELVFEACNPNFDTDATAFIKRIIENGG